MLSLVYWQRRCCGYCGPLGILVDRCDSVAHPSESGLVPHVSFSFLYFFSLSLCLGMCSLSFSNLSKPVSLSLHFASRLFTFLYSVFLGFLLTLWLTVWLRGCLTASSSPPFLVLLMVVPTPLTLCFLIPFEFEPVKFALLTDSSWLLSCPPAPLLIV